MIGVEVDHGLMGGAQQLGRELAAAELSNQGACVLWPIAHLQEVMVVLRGEVQELDVSP